jgi:hypothetical protein
MYYNYCKQTLKGKAVVLNRKSTILLKFFISLLVLTPTLAVAQDAVSVQDTGPSIMLGTQIPLQYSIGVNYHFSPVISARAQFGLLTKPYDRMVLATMEQFGLEKSLSRLIERSLNNGLMYTLGGNYHFGKNYVGIYGQYARLSGNISLEDAASAYFDRDLSFLSPFGVSLLELSVKSNINNIGLMYGRRFVLPNPRFEILAEAGIAKVIGSNNQFSTNQRLLEQVPLVRQLYNNLGADFANAYRRYGYLPSLNVYINYHF